MIIKATFTPPPRPPTALPRAPSAAAPGVPDQRARHCTGWTDAAPRVKPVTYRDSHLEQGRSEMRNLGP